MAKPTINEIADKLNEYKKNIKGDGEQIPIDPYTLVLAEYWLRWAAENYKEKQQSSFSAALKSQNDAILERLTMLATETPEEKAAREYREEIEREYWQSIEGGHSTHGPI